MVLITLKIILDPIFLYRDYKTKITEKVNEACYNECTKENGYILKVNKLTRITDNCISNVDSSIIFFVEVDVDNLKPELNDIFSDKVCMIFNGGLFINIKNKMKVLIPSNSLAKYKYMNNKTFVDDKNNVIKENDIIQVKIIGIKYSKKNFSCFGELV